MIYPCRSLINNSKGMTLIELVIVLAIVSILIMMALPSYQTHMLRVHRAEALRMLLLTAMCQEQVHASQGSYDTGLCVSKSEQKRYRQTYTELDTQGQSYTAIAIPQGTQKTDSCGNLTLDQSGYRGISATNVSVTECWNGR